MATTEVMDLMLKIGITEEVTTAFESISRLMEKVHQQVHNLHGVFKLQRGRHPNIAAIAAEGMETFRRRPKRGGGVAAKPVRAPPPLIAGRTT
jgi:hypothetical protein